jgi:hypothetical protein
MSGGVTYYPAFPEDAAFGAVINSFLFRSTRSCITNPEYEPEGMLKAILHALASYKCTNIKYLVVLILPVWEDTPWNSATIKRHVNMSTLIQILVGYMRFVSTHK